MFPKWHVFEVSLSCIILNLSILPKFGLLCMGVKDYVIFMENNIDIGSQHPNRFVFTLFSEIAPRNPT